MRKKNVFFKNKKRRGEKRVHSWLLPRTWNILLGFFSFDFLSSLKPKLETRLSISISQFFFPWHGSLTIIIHSLGTPEQRPEIEKKSQWVREKEMDQKSRTPSPPYSISYRANTPCGSCWYYILSLSLSLFI